MQSRRMIQINAASPNDANPIDHKQSETEIATKLLATVPFYIIPANTA
jgi:hypothetical protein